MATVTTGRDQNRRTLRGLSRLGAPRNYWTKKGPTYRLPDEQFRIYLVKNKVRKRIDTMVDSLSWVDQSELMTGDLSLRAPDRRNVPFDFILPGMKIICQVSPNGEGGWKELWRMRVTEITDATAQAATRSYPLANDVALLSASKGDYSYRQNKKHKKGWRVDQLVSDVGRRSGVKVSISKCKVYVKRLVMLNASPIDVIRAALKKEQVGSGRRLVISYKNGRLVIRPLKRSKNMLLLGPTIIEASLQAVRRPRFATALTVRGERQKAQTKDSKGKRRVSQKKVSVYVANSALIKRYGYIRQIVYSPDASTTAQARKEGKRFITAVATLDKTLTFNHTGISSLKRGDAIRLDLPELGDAQIVFVKQATHQLSGGLYTMEVVVQFEDPFVTKSALSIIDKLTETAVERKRKTVTKKAAKKKPVPVLNKTRQNVPTTSTSKKERAQQEADQLRAS